jgi:C1A family cysteine protease
MLSKKHLTRIAGLAMAAALLISTTPVAATENLLLLYQGGYIESELDSNTPVYDSEISTFAEVPLAFPHDASVFDTMYPQTKDQNPYGTCWSFASMGLAEYDLINDGAVDKSVDFSELQLAYFAYNFVTDPLGGTVGDIAKYHNENGLSYLQRGGNFVYSSRRLAQWIGPVDESVVPYTRAAGTLDSGLDDKYAYSYSKAHLKNAYEINIHENADEVKANIMEHGAAGIMYYHNDSAMRFYSFESAGHYTYYDTAKRGSGHAVMLVGWDDNFSKESFPESMRPKNDGAWLVRNSWGTYCDYFWMSYDNKSLLDTAWVFDFSDDDGLDHNYQLDGGIQVYNSNLTNRLANVFTVPKKADGEYEKLREVSLSFTRIADVGYTIDVYTNLTDPSDPLSGEKQTQATTTGNTAFAGIYSVELAEPVYLEPGSTFAVVVSVDKSALDYEQATKIATGDTLIWDRQVSQGNGKSLYYSSGRYGVYPYGNFCIKAFTSDETRHAEPENELTPEGYSVDLTALVRANLYASFSADIMEDAGARVKFVYPDGTFTEEPLSAFEITEYNNTKVKKITYEAVPAKLTERVEISIIKSDGTESNGFAFAPADYLNDLIKTDSDSVSKNIAKALLNYGAYAQLYFNEDTSDLANKELTDDAVGALTNEEILKMTVNGNIASMSNSDLEYIGQSLVCRNGTDLKLYFINKNSLTLDEILQKYNIDVINEKTGRLGSNDFSAELDGRLFCIRIKSILPKLLSTDYTITFSNGDGNSYGAVSPYSYIRSAVQGDDIQLRNLCKALFLYGRAAS